jgi:hypothetical protein
MFALYAVFGCPPVMVMLRAKGLPSCSWSGADGTIGLTWYATFTVKSFVAFWFNAVSLRVIVYVPAGVSGIVKTVLTELSWAVPVNMRILPR